MGSFGEVLVVQRTYFDPERRQWVVDPREDMGPDFRLEKIWTYVQSPTVEVRLMRLIEITDVHPEWQPTRWTESASEEFHSKRSRYEIEWVKQLP